MSILSFKAQCRIFREISLAWPTMEMCPQEKESIRSFIRSGLKDINLREVSFRMDIDFAQAYAVMYFQYDNEPFKDIPEERLLFFDFSTRVADGSYEDYSWRISSRFIELAYRGFKEVMDRVGGSSVLWNRMKSPSVWNFLDNSIKCCIEHVNSLSFFAYSIQSHLRHFGFRTAKYRNFPYCGKGLELFTVSRNIYDNVNLNISFDVIRDTTLLLRKVFLNGTLDGKPLYIESDCNISAESMNTVVSADELNHIIYRNLRDVFVPKCIEKLKHTDGNIIGKVSDTIEEFRKAEKIGQSGSEPLWRGWKLPITYDFDSLTEYLSDRFLMSRDYAESYSRGDYATLSSRYGENIRLFVDVICHKGKNSFTEVKCGLSETVEHGDALKDYTFDTVTTVTESADRNGISEIIRTGFGRLYSEIILDCFKKNHAGTPLTLREDMLKVLARLESMYLSIRPLSDVEGAPCTVAYHHRRLDDIESMGYLLREYSTDFRTLESRIEVWDETASDVLENKDMLLFKAEMFRDYQDLIRRGNKAFREADKPCKGTAPEPPKPHTLKTVTLDFEDGDRQLIAFNERMKLEIKGSEFNTASVDVKEKHQAQIMGIFIRIKAELQRRLVFENPNPDWGLFRELCDYLNNLEKEMRIQI